MDEALTEEYAVRLEELSEGKISRIRAGAILSRYLDESEGR